MSEGTGGGEYRYQADLPCGLGRALWGGIVFGGMAAGAGMGWLILTVFEKVAKQVNR